MSETVPAVQRAASIQMGEHGVRLSTLEDAFRFAKYVIASGLAPKGIDTPEKALIAMQAGAELGFSPMRSLAAVTVINGRAGLMGDAALAKIRQSKVCTLGPIIGVRGEGDARAGFCRFQRIDMAEPTETSFSIADAKRAGLWGKQGPWVQYPNDMLEWRAVARACKRYFGDVLLGLTVMEELRDYPTEVRVERDVTPPSAPDPLLAIAPTVPEPEPECDPATGEVIPDWAGAPAEGAI